MANLSISYCTRNKKYYMYDSRIKCLNVEIISRAEKISCILFQAINLKTETVKRSPLALESVDDVHGSDSLPLGVFGVSDGITDNILQEHFQYTTSLFVYQAGDTLDTSPTSETTDGWLGNTLDVVTEDFAMTLGTTW